MKNQCIFVPIFVNFPQCQCVTKFLIGSKTPHKCQFIVKEPSIISDFKPGNFIFLFFTAKNFSFSWFVIDSSSKKKFFFIKFFFQLYKKKSMNHPNFWLILAKSQKLLLHGFRGWSTNLKSNQIRRSWHVVQCHDRLLSNCEFQQLNDQIDFSVSNTTIFKKKFFLKNQTTLDE